MIERKFVDEFKKEYLVEEFIRDNLKGVGHSMTKVRKTPLGEKIIIYSSRPGLVVGRAGANIKKLTKMLKSEYHFENPQIEIAEVENVNLDPQIVAEKIANSLERFGVNKFKGIMHKTMTDVMNSGAKGVEIHLSGKLPSSRAKTWRVYAGYLKKCGDPAISSVKSAKMQALLKTGIIGIKIEIMPPDVILPDKIIMIEPVETEQGAKLEKAVAAELKKEKKPRKSRKAAAKTLDAAVATESVNPETQNEIAKE
jgi:small subunit ribosomal protein S3